MIDDLRTIELELVRRCQRGHVDAFDTLVSRYGDLVWRLCFRLTGNQTDAEDLVQEVWLTVWQQIARFRCESSFHTWLHRIAVNTCLQWRRKTGKHSTELLDEDRVTVEPAAEKVVIQKEQLSQIFSALVSLPETLQLPLVLKIENELTYGEISQILGCSTAAVKMRIARARMALEKAVQEDGS